MISIKHKGNFKKLDKYFTKSIKITSFKDLQSASEECLQRLIDATPVDSGLTANSWSFDIERKRKVSRVTFYNTNIQNGTKIALLLEYGHVSRGGTWVQGNKFIKPALVESYTKIVNQTWKELTNL